MKKGFLVEQILKIIESIRDSLVAAQRSIKLLRINGQSYDVRLKLLEGAITPAEAARILKDLNREVEKV